MDLLCSLFDAVANAGELFSRIGVKDQDVDNLATTVESIAQSVRAFSATLTPQEANVAFHANKVFPRMVEELKRCQQVIQRHRERCGPSLAMLEDSKPISILDRIRTSMGRSQSVFREGMETIGGRMGAVGQMVGLPEDELEAIRSASAELTRLVPLLHLAISAHAPSRGQKRPAPAGDAAAGPAYRPPVKPALGDVSSAPPLLRLRLTSESPMAPVLPELTMRDLRPASAANVSSMSLGDDDGYRFVFGRQELVDKVPNSLTLPAPSKNMAPQPFSRYVSRELFVLTIPRINGGDDEATLGRADEATLGRADEGTLGWGGYQNDTFASSDPSVATAKVLAKTGMHVRPAGQVSWKWRPKDDTVALRSGDKLALLLESPPCSSVPGPQKDLMGHEARCLLGLEIRPLDGIGVNPIPAAPGLPGLSTFGSALFSRTTRF